MAKIQLPLCFSFASSQTNSPFNELPKYNRHTVKLKLLRTFRGLGQFSSREFTHAHTNIKTHVN